MSFTTNKGLSYVTNFINLNLKIMIFKEFIGIDVSKLTLDVCIHSTQDSCVFENSEKGYRLLIKWISKQSKFTYEESLFIFEHTGLYSHNLSLFFTTSNLHFVILPGLEIKRSMGLVRGKDDKIDAKRIALYAFRRRDEIKPSKLPKELIIKMKQLLTLRNQLVKQRASLKTSLKEMSEILNQKCNKLLFQIPNRTIKALSKEINLIEYELKLLISTDEELDKQYKLICSVKGVGEQMALNMIVYTEGFQKFNNARQFAAYCGVAPFPHSSGSSIRGKERVSHLANKKLKSLINMCAMSAIQHSPEMKLYYQQKVLEGKNKMCIINNIRNKLLHRIFAVINRGTPYVEINKFAA